MTTLADLLVDLDAEYDDLRGVVDGLGDTAPEWDLPTPAAGWAVRDQISHLAYFDDAGRLAMVDPDTFARTVEEAMAMASRGDPMEVHLARGRSMGGDELLAWWGGAHRAMVEAFAVADPSVRVPWFGPPMGVLSFISARLMETWAMVIHSTASGPDTTRDVSATLRRWVTARQKSRAGPLTVDRTAPAPLPVSPSDPRSGSASPISHDHSSPSGPVSTTSMCPGGTSRPRTR